MLILCFTRESQAQITIQTSSFGGHTYHLVANEGDSRILWADAEAFAVTLGGHLVTVDDAAENEFLLDTFRESAIAAKALAHPSGGLLSMWIGYNDSSSEGNFTWVGGGVTGYTNWKPGEPGGSDFDEDFTGLLVTSDFGLPGQWHDVVSDFRLNDVNYGIVEVVGTVVELGDVNLDGVVNFLDISPFIAILSAGDYLAEADINEDGAVNFLDITPFIALLSS